MNDLNNWNLNEQQKNVVFGNKNENSLVISGAGTGKTKVLVFRIIFLIKEYSLNPNKILAITFSKKATDEIKIRVQKELNNAIELPWINTFHAFCFKILKHEIYKLEYSTNFSVIDPEDKKSILNLIYQEQKISKETLKINNAMKYIEICKGKNILIDQFLSEYKVYYKLTNEQCDILKILFNEYNTYLKKNNYLDFSDLLNFTYEIFKKFPDVTEKWSNNFDYVLIDEFQDTDDIQYFIIKSLIKNKHNNIFIVGDPDQSIYGWRNANPKNIETFKNDFPDSKVYFLEQNYRSTQEILNVANDIIKNNQTKFAKKLYSKNTNGDLPKYFLAQNQDLESTWIVKNIKELKKNDKSLNYNDIAILYRSNFLSRNIEHFLMQNDIPYYIYGSIKFYQRKEIKDLIAYLKVINNKDEISLARIINVPSRKITDKSIQKMKEFANDNHIKFYDSLKYVEKINIFRPAIKNVLDFYDLMENLKDKNIDKKISISKLLQEVIEKTEYKKEFDEKLDSDRLENIDELIESIKKYEQENPSLSLDEYLEKIQLLTNDNTETKRDSVQLMTVHSAKGLEFKYVFIFGLIENIFPSILMNNNEEITEEKIQEERRIMYVAVTRAKKQLFLSSSFGLDFNNNTKLPSRFIGEINPNNLQVVNSFAFENLKLNKKEEWFNSKNKINYENKFYNNAPEYMLHDKVQHEKFGLGVVIKVKEKTIVVAFDLPIGVKEILKNHSSITRKSK